MFEKINCDRNATVSFGFPNVWYAWYDLKASPKWQKKGKTEKSLFSFPGQNESQLSLRTAQCSS